MRRHPKVGAVGEHLFLGEPKHTMDFAEHAMPAVLGTPWLSWFLEHAAREAVLPWLEPGESTVGVELEVRHHASPLLHEMILRWRRDIPPLPVSIEAFFAPGIPIADPDMA